MLTIVSHGTVAVGDIGYALQAIADTLVDKYKVKAVVHAATGCATAVIGMGALRMNSLIIAAVMPVSHFIQRVVKTKHLIGMVHKVHHTLFIIGIKIHITTKHNRFLNIFPFEEVHQILCHGPAKFLIIVVGACLQVSHKAVKKSCITAVKVFVNGIQPVTVNIAQYRLSDLLAFKLYLFRVIEKQVDKVAVCIVGNISPFIGYAIGIFIEYFIEKANGIGRTSAHLIYSQNIRADIIEDRFKVAILGILIIIGRGTVARKIAVIKQIILHIDNRLLRKGSSGNSYK